MISCIRLIDGVVGDVHVGLTHVFFVRLLIGCCAEACQAFVGNERMDRVEPADDNIDAKVELESIDEERFVDVALDGHA